MATTMAKTIFTMMTFTGREGISNKMENRIDPLFWILESVSQHKMTLKIATNKKSYESCMNRIHHRMERVEFVSRLMKMYENGLVRIEKGPQYGGGLARVDVSNGELLQHLNSTDSESRFCYSLTTLGGDLFERLSVPNWDRFVKQIWTERVGQEAVVLEAKSNEFLHEYCQYVPIAPTGSNIVKVSEKMIEPFEATYWKIFDSGIQVNYDINSEHLTFEHLKRLRTKEMLKRSQHFTRWRRYGYSPNECEAHFDGVSDSDSIN